MYTSWYEDGWWACMRKNVEDIDSYQQPDNLSFATGSRARICGYTDGYRDAKQSISANIRRYGKEIFHQYLIQYVEDRVGKKE